VLACPPKVRPGRTQRCDGRLKLSECVLRWQHRDEEPHATLVSGRAPRERRVAQVAADRDALAAGDKRGGRRRSGERGPRAGAEVEIRAPGRMLILVRNCSAIQPVSGEPSGAPPRNTSM